MTCSNKRITCLDKMRYRFCFNTSSSVIKYGNIKHCPKYTTCCEHAGISPCIKQDFKQANLTIRIIDPVEEITKNTKINFEDKDESSVNITDVKVTSSTQEYTTFVTSTSNILLSTTQSTTEQNIITAKPTTNQAVKIKRKKKPNKIKSTNKVKKHKRKTLLTKVKSYLSKLIKKKMHKRKQTYTKNKNPATLSDKAPITKYTTDIINISTQKPFIPTKKPLKKSPTKLSLRNITQKMYKKAGTKRIPIKSSNLKVKQNKTKPHLEPLRFFSITNSVPLPVAQPEFKEASLNNLHPTDTKEVVTKVDEETVTEIIKTTHNTNPNQNDDLQSKNSPLKDIRNNSIIVTPGETSTALNAHTSSPIYTQSGFVKTSVFDSTSVQYPWSFPKLNIRSTTVSTVPTQLSACSLPTKLPGAKCNEYYECRKIMWANRLILFLCKQGESFDAETLNCIPNINCH